MGTHSLWTECRARFGDGVLTGRGTFQKYFAQGELKEYLQTALGAEAVPAAPGVLYLFKDETLREQFLAGGEANLKARESEPENEETQRLKSLVADLSMSNELLREKIHRLESGRPLA